MERMTWKIWKWKRQKTENKIKTKIKCLFLRSAFICKESGTKYVYFFRSHFISSHFNTHTFSLFIFIFVCRKIYRKGIQIRSFFSNFLFNLLTFEAFSFRCSSYFRISFSTFLNLKKIEKTMKNMIFLDEKNIREHM